MKLIRNTRFTLGIKFAMELVNYYILMKIPLVISKNNGFIVTVILCAGFGRFVVVICMLLLFTFPVAFSENQVESFIHFYILFIRITFGIQLVHSSLLID